MEPQAMAISIAPGVAAARGGAGARGGGLWLGLLCVVLGGYAMLGRGFAYVGYPPVYVGEALLAGGMLWFASRARWTSVDVPQVWLLAALAGWGAARTWPYIGEYGINALRDAAIWGYSAFGVIVLAYVRARPAALRVVLGWYRQFATVFLLGVPVVWAARFVLAGVMPRWPWADVPVIEAKAGDILVHLGGILAFWVVGFGGKIGLARTLLLGGCVAVLGAYERAGLLAFAMCFGICVVLRPSSRVLQRLALAGAVAVAALAASGIRFQIPSPDTGKSRQVSFDDVVANFVSLVGTTEVADLDDTKHWRLEWWGQIVGYTIRGPYRWTGKGFGVNLADDDGFQVMKDRSLRSPHNGHLTMLARAGVPGLGLWVIVQGAWAWSVGREYRRACRAGDGRWAALFAFLFTYWVAFMVNTTFDVFIEGPMGGIWFWTIYGLGLGAVWLARHCPEVLHDAQNPAGA